MQLHTLQTCTIHIHTWCAQTYRHPLTAQMTNARAHTHTISRTCHSIQGTPTDGKADDKDDKKKKSAKKAIAAKQQNLKDSVTQPASTTSKSFVHMNVHHKQVMC